VQQFSIYEVLRDDKGTVRLLGQGKSSTGEVKDYG
jgi:hypothetical protein